MSKFLSRKVLFSLIGIISNIGLPILFKKFELSEVVILTALGTISALVGVYAYSNIKDAKEQPKA